MNTNNDDLPFAKRYGYESIVVPFQVDGINEVLRTDLWNAFYLFIYSKLKESKDYGSGYGQESYRDIYKLLWIHFFKKPFDDFPNQDYQLCELVRTHIEKGIWYNVYE